MNTERYEFRYGIHTTVVEVPDSGVFEISLGGVITIEVERDDNGFKLPDNARDYYGDKLVPIRMFTYAKLPNNGTKTRK